MPKRQTRDVKERQDSYDLADDRKNKKRDRKPSEDVTWVRDTNLLSDDSDSDDSTYVPDESELSYNDFVEALLISCAESKPVQKKKFRPKIIHPALPLTKIEMSYFNRLPYEKRDELNKHMIRMRDYTIIETDIPLKFRILQLPISEFVKTAVLKKIKSIEDESSDSYKVRNWVDSFLRIPFGIQIPIPVQLSDGKEKCSQFMKESRRIMDKAVYGMIPAKTQIMQVLAQWMANPDSVGNVIALQGPAGVGKTSIARNGIAQSLKRPFQSFALGGASDISNFVGHSYTYEGSICGRIIDSLMQSECMNPVLYFDELDKISGTPHGEEIASMLIHLTDRSQNTQFHDRYFAGIDFDLSQCLFVFSFNDISLVNPILKDRMNIIHCSGYSEKDKLNILKDYIWPDLLRRLKFDNDDILLNDDAAKFMISEYSLKEEGVRTLIRSAESIITRLNMIRIADEEIMKEYKFYINVEFPLELNESIIKKLLIDTQAKESESWKSMYN
jgi:ATP-dependent Lon protease